MAVLRLHQLTTLHLKSIQGTNTNKQLWPHLQSIGQAWTAASTACSSTRRFQGQGRGIRRASIEALEGGYKEIEGLFQRGALVVPYIMYSSAPFLATLCSPMPPAAHRLTQGSGVAPHVWCESVGLKYSSGPRKRSCMTLTLQAPTSCNSGSELG